MLIGRWDVVSEGGGEASRVTSGSSWHVGDGFNHVRLVAYKYRAFSFYYI